MILLIDNYDSFTYNLYQYVQELTNEEVCVYRNDEISIDRISELSPSSIIFSPGPKRPEDANMMIPIIENFYKKIPMLGVCLGHQGICQVFGEKIVHAKKMYHGKTSDAVILKDSPLLKGINSPFVVGRYHSLCVERKNEYENLDILAISDDDEIMAISHKEYPVYGVQFHPESILMTEGKKIIENFLKIGGKND